MWQIFLRSIPPLIGALLLYSGGYKLVLPGEAIYALQSLEFSYRGASAIIAAVTILEIYLGVVLLVRMNLQYGLGAAMVLFLVFSSFLWYLSMLADPPSCGCLGFTANFESNRHNALFGLFRNCIILWLLKLSYDVYFKSPPAPLPSAA